eukprot:UN11082
MFGSGWQIPHPVTQILRILDDLDVDYELQLDKMLDKAHEERIGKENIE